MSECKHTSTHTDQPFAFSNQWYVVCQDACGKILTEGFASRHHAELAEQDLHEPHRFTIRWASEGTVSNGGLGEYKVSIPNYDGGEVVTGDHHDFVVGSLLDLLDGRKVFNAEDRKRIIERAKASIG